MEKLTHPSELKNKYNKKDYQWNIGHPTNSFDQLVKAIKKFGIFVYDDPSWPPGSDYAFIISKQKLTKHQLKEVSGLFNEESYADDYDDENYEKNEL